MSLREFTGAEKMKIRNQASAAVRDGRIPKTTHCERCGAGGEKWKHGLHKHHDDYSKPLEITWLCPPCHAARHLEIGRAPRSGVRDSGRNRPCRCVTIRPDLAAFAAAYFPKTRFGSLSRFVDSIILKHARLKKDELRKLGIPMPKDEVTA